MLLSWRGGRELLRVRWRDRCSFRVVLEPGAEGRRALMLDQGLDIVLGWVSSDELVGKLQRVLLGMAFYDSARLDWRAEW